ncbi:MAG TPA: carbonic anhydrase [Micromonosporaceae bacterium]
MGPYTPAQALDALIDGNRRFASGNPRYGHDIALAAAASGGQAPFAMVLGCIDSRVPLEAVFDQTFGCICVVRSGGHVLDEAVLGSVEFAVGELAVPLVMVLGHVRCGAVGATVDALRSGRRPSASLGYLVDEIAPAVHEVGMDRDDVVDAALRRHVGRTVARLGQDALVRERLDAGRLDLVGAVYDLDSGKVELLQP